MTENRGPNTEGRMQRTEAIEFGMGNAECGIENTECLIPKFPHSNFRILETFYPIPSAFHLVLKLCLFRGVFERFHRTLPFGDAIHRAVKVSGPDKFLMGNGHVAIIFAVRKFLLLKF